MSGARALLLGIASAFGAGACAPAPPLAPPRIATASAKPSPPAPKVLAEETEPATPELRAGRIQPVEHGESLQLKVRRHAIDGEEQLLEVVLPQFAQEVPGDSFWLGTEARITGSSAPFQLVSRGNASEMVLWLRRSKADLAADIMGDAYTPALGGRSGHHFRFQAKAPSGGVSPELATIWAAAAVDYLAARGGAFGNSAAARLHERYRLPGALALGYANFGGSEPELGRLLATFAPRTELQTSLATHRRAVLAAAGLPRNLPLEQLRASPLEPRKWAELAKFFRPAPPEALAKAVPADFYFVRARSFASFADVLSSVQQLGAPLADVLQAQPLERATLTRYLTELGIEAGDLSRVLGPEVVEEFALTGSDPYLHEGSDLTLIFRLKNAPLFRAALSLGLAVHGAAHGGTKARNFSYEGVSVEVARSADGRVRQHHAIVGELELISNSGAALKRVIATLRGKSPPLADEPDFGYLLARDQDVPAEVLACAGQRFAESVAGPAQKVAELRREIAFAELTVAPTAALLYGWVHGKSAIDSRELVRAGLLAAGELRHADGARITWAPGAAPRSIWGTPAALEPLIELPPVVKVSTAERDAYGAYYSAWIEGFDPMCLRLSGARRGDANWLHAELRVVPQRLARAAERLDVSGAGRVSPGELGAGARLSIALGESSPLRVGLDKAMNYWLANGAVTLDWVGDYAVVGVADGAEMLAARWKLADGATPFERPPSAEELGRESAALKRFHLLNGLPVYAAVGLKSKAGAALALNALRQGVTSSAPGALGWAPFATYRGVEVVRVLERAGQAEFALYYALTGDSLLVTFNRSVLRSLVDQALDGKLPLQGKAAARKEDGQAVLELAASKKGSLRTLLTWAFSVAALQAAPKARAAAEAVLRGVPESAHEPDRSAELARAYLGSSPLTPDGRRYWLSAEGIADPLRGTAHAPQWPSLPTEGSAADDVLSLLSRLRSDLAFEDEPEIPGPDPRLRSLRARLDLWRR